MKIIYYHVLFIMIGASAYLLLYHLRIHLTTKTIYVQSTNIEGVQRHREDSPTTFLKPHDSQPGFYRDNSTVTDGRTLTHRQNDMTLRVKHIHDTCHSLKTKASTLRQSSIAKILYFPKMDIAYCRVLKAGSSFLSALFYLLQSKRANPDEISKMSSYKIHTTLVLGQNKGITNTYPTIIAARDPFTRLYSGYVDKILLQLQFWKHLQIQKLQQSISICNESATFEGFLKYVLTSGKGDPHWTPVSSICKPCRLDPYMIIKQETFNEDVEILMTSLNVTPSTYHIIKDAMTLNRIKNTVTGTVEEAIYYYESPTGRLKTCPNITDALNIIWASFQIQGYIHSKMDFPKHQFSNITQLSKELNKIKNVFMTAVQSSTMSRSESRAQRRHYLVDAYTGVSNKTLNNIVKLFDQDFLLFNYDKNPPLEQ